MAAVLLARVLNTALHLAIVGILIDVDFQVNQGRAFDALTHTAIVCVCILMLALAGYFATKLLGKNPGSLRIDVTHTPTKKPRSTRKKGSKNGARSRKRK